MSRDRDVKISRVHIQSRKWIYNIQLDLNLSYLDSRPLCCRWSEIEQMADGDLYFWIVQFEFSLLCHSIASEKDSLLD